jgi:mono/diheme cytochrome c family protein
MRRLRVMLVSVLILAAAGCRHRVVDVPPPAERSALVARGDSIFHVRACARCHGPDAKGTRNGPSLLGPTFLHVRGGYSEFIRIITSGVPTDSIKDKTRTLNMQPRGGLQNPLNDADIRAVAAYVYSLSHPSSPAPTASPRQSPADSIAAERDRFAKEVLALIKGREQAPVESVFTNLQVLGGFPAVNLVRAMDQGWSRALGVSCTYCHVPGDWANDAKPAKSVARDMVRMGSVISTQLRGMEGLKDRRPIVNCMTCHRGQLKPALNLPP